MNDFSMTKRIITQCPVCDAAMRVSELSCTHCDTRLSGAFESPPLARLPAEHQRFAETFLLCRGVIRDVERELGVSYPTVRARLDAAVAALETVTRPASPMPIMGSDASQATVARQQILHDVQAGRLSPADAAEALRKK
ncbi:MAG: DUF2089 domain-containing protein [Armatimonadetes bacterium]|nr:DUF2089 domain-containing protein [Armatimonadota bacterium]